MNAALIAIDEGGVIPAQAERRKRTTSTRPAPSARPSPSFRSTDVSPADIVQFRSSYAARPRSYNAYRVMLRALNAVRRGEKAFLHPRQHPVPSPIKSMNDAPRQHVYIHRSASCGGKGRHLLSGSLLKSAHPAGAIDLPAWSRWPTSPPAHQADLLTWNGPKMREKGICSARQKPWRKLPSPSLWGGWGGACEPAAGETGKAPAGHSAEPASFMWFCKLDGGAGTPTRVSNRHGNVVSNERAFHTPVPRPARQGAQRTLNETHGIQAATNDLEVTRTQAPNSGLRAPQKAIRCTAARLSPASPRMRVCSLKERAGRIRAANRQVAESDTPLGPDHRETFPARPFARQNNGCGACASCRRCRLSIRGRYPASTRKRDPAAPQ
ncbi:hypothetical protein FQR65_LT19024 [Abscondita terminalis]|nr:hypothetical protein FQR65_LT19024 [Abscondita terminalis]